MNYALYIHKPLLSNSQSHASNPHTTHCRTSHKRSRMPVLPLSNSVHQVQNEPQPVHTHPSISSPAQLSTLLPIQKLLNAKMCATGSWSIVSLLHHNAAVIKIMLSGMLQKQWFPAESMPNQQCGTIKQVTDG